MAKRPTHKKNPSNRSPARRSHAEILKARRSEVVSGADKIARRLQKRLDRLVKMGVVNAGFLPKGVTGHDVTRRQLDDAEKDLAIFFAKYDKF